MIKWGGIIAICYSVLWYAWGHYIKIHLKEIISESLQKYSTVNYDSVEFKGYPFSFYYTIKNLTLVSKNKSNSETALSFRTVEISSDVAVKNFKIDIDHPLHISINNKDVYFVKWDEGSRMNIKLKKSLLEQLLTYQKFESKISSFFYFDSGYNVLDQNLNKIVFISHNNRIKIRTDEASNYIEYKILINLNGEGGADSPPYAMGEQRLNVDMRYKVYRQGDKEINFVDDADILFHKFQLKSEKCKVNINGNLKRSAFTENKIGQINVDIISFSSFSRIIDELLYKNHAELLKNLFLNTSENKYDHQTDKISFSIVGTKNGIKYGNMNSQAFFVLIMQTYQQLMRG